MCTLMTNFVIFDAEGYAPLREFLINHQIRHVLLVGYATDMCFCKTTAGYENLSKDFNVFLVGYVFGHFSFELDSEICRECSHLFCRPQSTDHASLLGSIRNGVKAMTKELTHCNTEPPTELSRRTCLAKLATFGGVVAASSLSQANAPIRTKAKIAITLDLEIGAAFHVGKILIGITKRGILKGAKDYAVRKTDLVKAKGGHIHFFLVGSALGTRSHLVEETGRRSGHPIGNHTYDHVNLLATQPKEIQFKFQRSPWLISGQTIAQVIHQNIELAKRAIKGSLGIEIVASERLEASTAASTVAKIYKRCCWNWDSTG